MHVHDLRKIIEAVPYDFEVHILNICGSGVASTINIDFDEKIITIGVE